MIPHLPSIWTNQILLVTNLLCRWYQDCKTRRLWDDGEGDREIGAGKIKGEEGEDDMGAEKEVVVKQRNSKQNRKKGNDEKNGWCVELFIFR